jgi:hypothetical protein
MYLSHNIVNKIVDLEIALNQLNDKFDNEKIAEELEKKQIETLFYFANSMGVAISLKDAKKLLVGKRVEVEDFRGQLLENVFTAFQLILTIADNENIDISTEILHQINVTIARGTVEDWQLKYREEGDTFSNLYDDLTPLVTKENRSTHAQEKTEQILVEFKNHNQANSYYRVSMLMYELLKLQPFISYNKITLALLAEMLLLKFSKKKYVPGTQAEFFTQFKGGITNVYSHQQEANREVAFHELFLGYLADKALTLADKHKSDAKFVQATDKPFLDLNKRQLKILKYLQTIPTVKREDYVQMMEVSTMTAYRDLNELVDNKLIKIKGHGRGTKYMLSSR